VEAQAVDAVTDQLRHAPLVTGDDRNTRDLVLSTLKAGFFSSAQTGLETALLAGRPHRGMGSRQRLRMSITGSSSGDA
jgi:hypothetical protein